MHLKLKEFRKSRKLNQQAVADVLNCSQAVYSRYESGDREPPIEALIRLADFYNVSLDELVGRVPMPIEVIHGDPPPLQDGEVELVFEADEKTPSADELERMITDIVLRELKKQKES
jgi:transcriptional regulator with XRE-family HTH domain